MKKYFAILFLVVFILPSVVFASWWNPFSWSIFHKKEIPTPIQTTNIETVKNFEEKITEPQKQITSTTTTPKTKGVKKVIPVVNNSAIIKAQVEAVLKTKAEEQAKIDQQKLEAEKQQAQALQQIQQSVQQISQNTAPDACPNIDGIQAVTPSGMTKDSNNNCIAVAIITTYTIKNGDDIVKSGISLEEVRTFVSDLNNYLTWRKKAETATIEELQNDMLSPNGYTLTQNN